MKFMKTLAINGSPREGGNTSRMLKRVLAVCEKSGIETEFYQAGGRPIQGCLACEKCFENPGKCVTQDWIQDVYEKMKESDAILLGSPTYYGDLTPEIKAIMDRCGYLAMSEGGTLKRKIGAAVTAVRRAGGLHTLDSMQHFFLIQSMVVPGSSYWNMSLALEPSDFDADSEGIATMDTLGENIVWLLQKLISTTSD
jgi:multimeric flavodoxin WrbA